MANRSLGGRLLLLGSMLIASGLALGWDVPDYRPPGEGEGERGTGKFCPLCGFELTLRTDMGNILFCDDDGEVDGEEALASPPPPR
jgi:hypothetical protein